MGTKMLLSFVGGMLLTTAMLLNVNALLGALEMSRTARLIAAAAIGLWIGLQVSLATAGAFGSQLALAFPLVGFMVALPVLAVGVGAWANPQLRSRLLAFRRRS
jgi:hypothetical protein